MVCLNNAHIVRKAKDEHGRVFRFEMENRINASRYLGSIEYLEKGRNLINYNSKNSSFQIDYFR